MQQTLNKGKYGHWVVLATIIVSCIIVLTVMDITMSPGDYMMYKHEDIVNEVVYTGQIHGNVYAVFYKDYYDDFTCALVARDGVFWSIIAEPLYPSDPFDEENKRLVYERNGEKYWLDYGSIWYPNSDFRVTLDGVPMNFIKIDKTWSVYCMSGRAEGPEYENKPFLHVLLPYGREF